MSAADEKLLEALQLVRDLSAHAAPLPAHLARRRDALLGAPRLAQRVLPADAPGVCALGGNADGHPRGPHPRTPTCIGFLPHRRIP